MSDFTVFDVAFPPETKQRVIVNTDAKNEADDQYAIVHAVLTPSFDLHGIIPAHVEIAVNQHIGRALARIDAVGAVDRQVVDHQRFDEIINVMKERD